MPSKYITIDSISVISSTNFSHCCCSYAVYTLRSPNTHISVGVCVCVCVRCCHNAFIFCLALVMRAADVCWLLTSCRCSCCVGMGVYVCVCVCVLSLVGCFCHKWWRQKIIIVEFLLQMHILHLIWFKTFAFCLLQSFAFVIVLKRLPVVVWLHGLQTAFVVIVTVYMSYLNC